MPIWFFEPWLSGLDKELGTFELAPSLAFVSVAEPFPLPREEVEYFEELCWEANIFCTLLM